MVRQIGLAIVALAVPGALGAQVVWGPLTNYCATGSGTACLSSQVSTQWNDPDGDGVNRTYATIFVQNNDLAMGLTDGYRISGIGLTAPELEDPTPEAGAMGVEDGAQANNNPEDDWSFGMKGTGNTTLFFETGTNNVSGGIEGCLDSNAGNDPDTNSFFRTCVDGANAGWVTFSFSTSNQWAAGDAQLAYRFMSGGDEGDDWSMNCPSGDFDCTTEVVPEPATVALLATGLLGVGYVAIRRRREDTFES